MAQECKKCGRVFGSVKCFDIDCPNNTPKTTMTREEQIPPYMDYDVRPVKDNVNHPKHYTSHPSGVECIEITRHYCFSIGNAIKYLWRAGLKKEMGLEDVDKEIEDLNKAIWYINDRIKQLTNELPKA